MDLQNMFRTDDGNFVRFDYRAVENRGASVKAGRPIYNKGLFATIMSPGQKNSDSVQELELWDGERLVKQNHAMIQMLRTPLEKFKSMESGGDLGGTPIENLPGIDIRQVAELKALNIHTIDALDALPDSGLQRIGMGGRELQKRARAYIETAKGNAPMVAMTAELEKRDAQIADLQRQIKELAAMGLAEPKADEPKKGPGRPRKPE